MADTFLHGGVAFWTAVLVLLQFAATVVAIYVLYDSITSFGKSLTESNYSEMDSMYFELLKLAVEKPHLVDASLRDSAQEPEYDTYAFMVWNFVETIYDRCHTGKCDEHLRVTWDPVIDAENRRHREWFDAAENRAKFKEEFQRFMDRKRYRGAAHLD